MSLLLALAACLCAGIAAYCWYKSAKVEVMPTWVDGNGPNPLSEPIIKTLSQEGWIAGTVRSVTESAKWNKRGALWSAGAVALTALSSLASAMGQTSI